tara:strand:+ start:6804 stop:8696 length:1893 start_codon:yes stop_codon:yes gene_type:complete
MKFCLRLFISIFLLIPTLDGRDFDERDFPVQDGGRIKPLDTYARNQLLAFYGKRSVKHKNMSAVDWIIDLTLNPAEGESKKVFNIRSPEVVASLKLDWTNDHKYSFNELIPGLQKQFELISEVYNKPDESRTVFEQQLLELYINAMHFRGIALSLSCLVPSISVNDSILAEKLNIPSGKAVSYAHLVTYVHVLSEMMQGVINKSEEELTDTDRELSIILIALKQISSDNFAQALKLIPPSPLDETGTWLSPWELMDGRPREPYQDKILNALEKYLSGRALGDENKIMSALMDYETGITSLAKGKPDINLLKKETWVNKANLFYNSVAFYLLAFIFLGVSWMFQPKWLKRTSAGLLVLGLLYHAYGIYLRMVIMERPPVSTLYETVIFVGLTAVVCAVIIEYFRRDGLGLFIGSVSGAVFHYIGFGYAADGDTLGMLVAVLNSNFWLATHVTTITLGYGASLVAGFIGHLYLIQVIRSPGNKTLLKSINKNMFGMTLIALFFTLFGTILGGIWADQSWGRFWGWDPKENGALLIVMWQLMMVHMRLTGLAKPTGFALGMIMNNIVVVIAWFGVNLLNVGLHSYGFAGGVAQNLALFTALELMTGFGTYYWAKSRKRSFALPVMMNETMRQP